MTTTFDALSPEGFPSTKTTFPALLPCATIVAFAHERLDHASPLNLVIVLANDPFFAGDGGQR